MLVEVVTAYVGGATADARPADWDLDTLWAALATLYPVGIEPSSSTHADGVRAARKELLDAVVADAERALAEREADIEALEGEGAMRLRERDIILDAMDRRWREHLCEMDYLKEGIGLRAMAQQDPVVEFRREGYEMFVAMLDGLKEECVAALFRD